MDIRLITSEEPSYKDREMGFLVEDALLFNPASLTNCKLEGGYGYEPGDKLLVICPI